MPESIALNQDCLSYMKTLPDGYFDLCVADPPYGAGFTETGGCQGWFSKYHQDGEENRSKFVNVERERERIPTGGGTASARDSTDTRSR